VEYLALICAREGVPLMLDPAPARELPPSIFKHIAWLTPNQTEAAFLTKSERGDVDKLAPAEMATLILSKGSRGVVLKLGSHGVYLVSREVLGELLPAFPVTAIDTTAAGDAFNGGFATGLMLGKPPVESAWFASAVAAISVTRRGAQPSMPNMAEVKAFMKNNAKRTTHR
jgi:ribokinase